MKSIELMTDPELLDEIEQQSEWASDDAFELAAFDRGDGGLARDGRLSQMYAEAVRRGLCKPIPEDDPDFEEICSYMACQGYVWHRGKFVQGMAAVSFQDATAEWHAQYVETARKINHQEMWGK